MSRRIGIVGGGLLGMTLALRFAERGFEVTLLEAAERIGGLASPTRIGNYTWDQFYHVILLSDTNLLTLLEKFQLREEIHWGQTKTGFFTDGHFYSMSNIMEFLSFPPLNILDKLRLGFTIFYASRVKSWERLEENLVKDWLVRLSGSRTFNKIWLPLLKSKLGENYRVCSASFIWAIIARMYAARRTGLKKEMFGYVKGGYAIILDRFQQSIEDHGVEIMCNTFVNQIKTGKDGVDLSAANGTSLNFDDVILTVPSVKIPSICPQISSQEKRQLTGIDYQGVICLALVLKRPLGEFYVTNITEEWVPFTGIIEMTALVDREEFDGNSLVYLPKYLPQGDSFWEKSDYDIQEEFVKTLQRMYPSFNMSDILASRMVRATHVLPIMTLRYSRELLPSTRTSLDHVFVVNSSQIANGTMNVNETIGLGERKSLELIDLLTRKVRSHA
jgi:protoporphyrinogen oxidase